MSDTTGKTNGAQYACTTCDLVITVRTPCSCTSGSPQFSCCGAALNKVDADGGPKAKVGDMNGPAEG